MGSSAAKTITVIFRHDPLRTTRWPLIAGERIRDKIAASKKKGIWMGGNVPLGYDVKDRKLIINEPKAAMFLA